jgi:hypothetical protein
VLNFVFDSFNPFKKEKLIDLNLPELQIIVKAVPLGKRIGDEVIIWESPWLSGPPYALNIHALEKTKDELVGGPPSVVKKEDYKYRYLHILVHGCNNNVQAGKPKADPKVLCEVRFCVEKIFEGTAQRSGVLGTLGKARKFKWRHHFQAADALTKIRRQEEELKKSSKKSSTDSDNGSSVQAGSRSFFAAGPKTLTEADLEDACNVSLCADSDEGAASDEEETQKINRSQSVIFGAAVAAPASGGGLFSRLAKAASKSSTPVDKFQIIGSSKDKCGMVQCKFFYNTKPVILAEGDDLYQARIALLTRKEGDKWKRNIATLFADECKLQALMTSKFIRTLEGLRRGWKYETFVVVDLHGECLRSTYDSLSKIEGEEGLRRDDDFILRCPVWRVLSEVYQNFAYFEENSSMRVFAGGGLLSPIPPKKVEGDAVFGDYEEGGHPSHGFGRESAFPLSQEVIQAEGGFFDAIGISSISRDENLHSFMQRSKFDSWGGWDYCRSKRFGGIDQLLDAFCESISIYCPSVVEDDVAALQKRRNDFQNDAQSMLNMRFKSLSAIMEGEKVLEDGNTLHMLEKFPEEFYSKVPLNFDASLIERLIDDLPAPNTIQFGVWIINKIPNEIEINNISRVCKRYSEEVVIDPKKSQNGAAQQALLLVLCPDEQIDYLDPSPFKELLLAIGTATGLSINDDNKSIVKLVIF